MQTQRFYQITDQPDHEKEDQEDVEGSPDMPQDNTKDNLKAESVVVAADQNEW